MNTITVRSTRNQIRLGPHYVAVPILAVILAFYGKQLLSPGAPGIVTGALIGALWAVGLGLFAQRLARREEWRVRLANSSVFLSIIVIGLTIGGGLMYASMMKIALTIRR